MPDASQLKLSRRPSRIALVAMFTVAVVAPLAALQQEPYKIGDEGVTSPRLISQVDPEYTKEAKEAKIQGTVVIAAVVGRSGRIENAHVTQSLDAGLDANAIVAVKQWEFEPGTRNAEPVAVQVTIEVTFRLQ